MDGDVRLGAEVDSERGGEIVSTVVMTFQTEIEMTSELEDLIEVDCAIAAVIHRLRLMAMTYRHKDKIVEMDVKALTLLSLDREQSILPTEDAPKFGPAIVADMVQAGALREVKTMTEESVREQAVNKVRELAEENANLRMSLSLLTDDLRKNILTMDKLIADQERATRSAFVAGKAFPGTYEEWRA